jgi:lipase ATG15
MLSTTLLSFLLFALPTPATITQVPLIQPANVKFVKPPPVTLHLRHLHSTNASRVLFADVAPEAISPNNNAAHAQTSYTLDTVLQNTHRPSSFAAHAQARMNAMRRGAGLSPTNGSAGELTWEEDEVIGPDVTNRETLLMLAKMTSNAYVFPEEKGWYDVGGKWNVASHCCS